MSKSQITSDVLAIFAEARNYKSSNINFTGFISSNGTAAVIPSANEVAVILNDTETDGVIAILDKEDNESWTWSGTY